MEVQGYLFGRPLPSGDDAPAVEALNRSTLRTSAA